MTTNTSTTGESEAARNAEFEHGDSYVDLDGVRKTFNDGEIVACDDVNIDIDEGEFVVLVGPSGCGKTTTLRCIAGLEEPDEGTITVDGRDITHKKSKDRDLAFVFQSIALFPHMSVRKNIRFGLDMKTDLPDDEKNRRVDDVAKILDIEEMLDRKPSALSGGQQQRVSLGRAMVMEPSAFLLDEPFSALDANLRDQMRVEVKKIQRQLNTAMIFVTHDQEEAMTLGDQIVVMDDGTVQQIGTPHEIYNEPDNMFVADFIGSPSPNLFDCEVAVDGDSPYLRGDEFSLELSAEQADALRDRAGEHVIFGIRPEYLDVTDTTGDFEAAVDVVEPLGDRDAVHLSVDETTLSAVTSQGKIPRGTERVTVDMDIAEGWVFTPDGERLV